MSFTNRSVLFGGTNEYATMGDVLNFERTDSFSISFWLRTTASGYIVSKMDSTPQGWGAYITASSGIEFLLINTPATNLIDVFGPTGLNDGRWHHVVWTYDGSSTAAGVTCYVDGSAVSTTVSSNSLSATLVNTGPLNLASRTNGTGVYTGSLDEVAVYNKELTSGEVTTIYNGGLPNDLSVSGPTGNLVAWWRMGEGDTFPVLQDHGLVGTNLACPDLSPSGFDGTPTNMESGDVQSNVAGGRASTFNGTDEYVDHGNVLSYERTQPFSISFWLKRVGDGSQDTVLAKFDGSVGWFVWVSNTTLDFGLTNTWTTNQLYAYVSASVSDGAWHHVVITYPGDSVCANVKFYVDGVLLTTIVYYDTLTATILNAASFKLGMFHAGAPNYYLGGLDEVTIYDKELSLAEAQWIYNSGAPRDPRLPGAPSNLVGYWRMGDGATPPTIPDLSSSGFDGTMTNMDATNFVDGVPGAFSHASFLFDGVDEYVTMGNVLNFDYNQALSLSFWIKHNAATNGVAIAKMGDGPPYGWAAYVAGSGSVNFTMAAVSATNQLSVYTTPAPITLGLWHHVVITKTTSPLAAGLTIYVNGVSQAKTVQYDTLTSTISNVFALTLGRRMITGGELYLAGSLDEVLVYDVALTPTQVTDLYGFGAPVDPTALDSWVDAVGYWRMGEASFDGTMTNMESTDITYSTPAGFDGQDLLIAGTSGAKTFRGRPGVFLDQTFKAASLSTIYYRMRAWNLNTNDWELWTAEGAPNENNPSGDPITNVAVLTVWEA